MEVATSLAWALERPLCVLVDYRRSKLSAGVGDGVCDLAETHLYVCINAGGTGDENVPGQVTELAQLIDAYRVCLSGHMGMHVVHVFACLWG